MKKKKLHKNKKPVKKTIKKKILKKTNFKKNNIFGLSYSKKFKDQLFQSNYINSLINVNQVNKLLQKDYMNNAESKFIFCVLNLGILSNLK